MRDPDESMEGFGPEPMAPELDLVAPEPAGPLMNPAQRATFDLLRTPAGGCPTFGPDLREDLRDLLEADLSHIVAGLEESVKVDKRRLSAVHGCEALYLAPDDFVYSVPVCVGAVAHKAVELSINSRMDVPAELVDAAIGRLVETEHWTAEFLRGITEVERAELRANATDRVCKYLETFPVLEPKWRPVTESSTIAVLCGSRVEMRGKVDLAFGKPHPSESRRVIVDFKTGMERIDHREDMRVYALIETLRTGIPPRLIVSFYLDQGRAVAELVTEDLLHVTVRRVLDGVERMVALRNPETVPRRKPGWACRRCPLLGTCDVGRAHLDARAADDGVYGDGVYGDGVYGDVGADTEGVDFRETDGL